MVSSKTLGGWACVAIVVIVAQYNTLEVTATAEICHAPHDDLGGSCMDCAVWMNCFPGEVCDTHCSECGHCYEDTDSDGCDEEPCSNCMGCASCGMIPQSCIDNCTVCVPYQKMLNCQGQCKPCEACYANFSLPGCDGFCEVECGDCASCSVMPSCHDCRCCQDAGCAPCEGEPVECPAEGYTMQELANSWVDAPRLPYDSSVDCTGLPGCPASGSSSHSSNAAKMVVFFLVFLAFALCIGVAGFIKLKPSVKDKIFKNAGSEEESVPILPAEKSESSAEATLKVESTKGGTFTEATQPSPQEDAL